jgi:aminoglycoside phosphotransferase (APT) family kinase protein
MTQRIDDALLLEELLRNRIPGGCKSLIAAERLTAGAVNMMFKLVYTDSHGEHRQLCLRRRFPQTQSDVEVGVQTPMPVEVEAGLLQLAHVHGVPTPKLLHLLEESDGLGEGFVMEWLEGETLGQRIVKREEFQELRESGRLAVQCGEIIGSIQAKIGAADTALLAAAGLETRSAQDVLERYRVQYETMGIVRPSLDFIFLWLAQRVPRDTSTPVLVHGDFRNGNLMMDGSQGVVGVLDWVSQRL